MFCLFSITITLLFTKIDNNKMCLTQYQIFLQLQIDIEIFYRLQSHLTLQTEHQSRLGIVRVSFRDRVNQRWSRGHKV